MVARLRPGIKRRRVPDSDDFIIDNNRINLAAPDIFKHDPVNLIRIFRLAQKNNLAFHPDAMRTVTRSLRLINTQLRENPVEAGNMLCLLFFQCSTDNACQVADFLCYQEVVLHEAFDIPLSGMCCIAKTSRNLALNIER